MTALTGLDFVTKQALVGLVARGTPLVQACEMVGTNRRAVNSLLKSDPEFMEDMLEAKDRMVARVDHVVFEEAVDGNMKAVEMFYRLHRPEVMQTGAQSARSAGAPALQVAQLTVQIVQALVSGETAEQWFGMLHVTPAIEVAVIEDGEPE